MQWLEPVVKMVFQYARIPPERARDLIMECQTYMVECVQNVRAMRQHMEETNARLGRLEKHFGISSDVLILPARKDAARDN